MKKKVLWLIAAVIVTILGVYVFLEIDLSVLKRLTFLTAAYLVILTIIFVFFHVLGVKFILKGMNEQIPLKQVFLKWSSKVRDLYYSID